MDDANRKIKVALLINMISPARIPLYSSLAEAFDLLILHGGTERNRDSWEGAEKSLPKARIVRAWGWQIPFTRKQDDQAFDEQYLHVNPGYFWSLLRFSPDVVVTGEMGFRTILALLYGFIFARPVWVWWGRSLHTERNKAGRPKRFLRPLLARCIRHWISYGHSSTQYLSSLKVPRGRILELQNAPNEDYFRISVEPLFRLRPRPVLLYVGQFIARKGVDHFLRAAAALQREGFTFSLLLVGSGRDRQAAVRLCEELNLGDVHFRPAQLPQLMPAVYRSADALVFPTLEDPWGLVASEAILAGLPVLCSKYAGCAEELFPAECVFDPENTAEFVEKLRLAVEGLLPSPDLTRMRTSAEVAADLIAALRQSAIRRSATRPEQREFTAKGGLDQPREQ